jgi:GR25 family glycosyltransferase involved in LPS biosynthesis
MKTYVLNHPEFSDRRKIITSSLDSQSIEYEIIDRFGPESFDQKLIDNANYNIHNNLYISQIKNYSYINNPNKKNKSSISLVLKHMDCWKKQVYSNNEFILILEDDCEIPNGFSNLIENIETELSKSYYDLVMIGTFLDFISPDISEKLLKYHKDHKTRCTHAYIISKNASIKMLDACKNINNAIDYKMNETIQLNNLKVAWIEPGLKQII